MAQRVKKYGGGLAYGTFDQCVPLSFIDAGDVQPTA